MALFPLKDRLANSVSPEWSSVVTCFADDCVRRLKSDRERRVPLEKMTAEEHLLHSESLFRWGRQAWGSFRYPIGQDEAEEYVWLFNLLNDCGCCPEWHVILEKTGSFDYYMGYLGLTDENKKNIVLGRLEHTLDWVYIGWEWVREHIQYQEGIEYDAPATEQDNPAEN